MPGEARTLSDPAFAHDDGSADQRLRTELADPAATAIQLARRLRSSRLLASVVAIAGGVDEGGGDKDSHMAVVSMLNEHGERGLLAFTGTDSLSAWNADARPVPAWGRDIARSARDDGAHAVVIDVAGPHRVAIAGAALDVLADSLDLESVTSLIVAALDVMAPGGAGSVTVIDARDRAGEVDVLVEVPEHLMARAATILSTQRDIHRQVPGGIGVSRAPAVDGTTQHVDACSLRAVHQANLRCTC